MTNKTEFSWKAPEYIFYPKTKKWYIVLGIIGVVSLVYALFTKDFLMFFTLGILLVAGYFSSHKQPKILRISITEEGLKIDDMVYPYDTVLKKFWLHYHPPLIKTLNFETTNYINKEISLELEDEDPVAIRAFLLQYLEEDLQREESYLDRVLRAIKF